MIKKITSTSNSLIQQVASLHNSKHRTHHSQFIAEGIRTVTTFIQGGYKPLNLFITEEHIDLANDLKGIQTSIIVVTKKVMNKISTANTPSGILAVFSIPSAPSIETINSGIVLAGMRDPGNVGTLVRTAAAMNKKSAIFIESVDPWSPKVVQASTGAMGLMNVFTTSWELLIALKKRPKLCALTVSQGSNPNKVDFTHSLIVVGGEARGLPKDWTKQCEQNITLPMPGGFESLNAAIAGSIALYLSAI